MEAKANWTSIPNELLGLVLDKLLLLPDYLHFSIVCKSWNNVARSQFDLRKAINTSYPQLPMLLVASKDDGEKKHGLYDIIKHKILEYKVSVPYNWRCCGSSHGWLFFANKTHLFMSNPFTGEPPRKLPPVKFNRHEEDDEWFYIQNVYKAVLSCDPSLYPNDYEVVVIYSEYFKLAIFKAGDKAWREIKGKPPPPYVDVIRYKENFYVLNQFMGLWKINVQSYKIDMIVPQWDDPEDKGSFPYLVESSKGHLICALRIMDDEDNKKPKGQLFTSSFMLFKLERVLEGDPYMRWVNTNTLGGDTVFVGENHSLAINSENIVGCPPNCIYFTDNLGSSMMLYRQSRACDMGFFNMETQSLGPHFNIDCSHAPSIWIVPSLN